MMSCNICGDTQGPWEYEEYKPADRTSDLWKQYEGHVLLVCEDCAKVLRKRMKNEGRKKWFSLSMQ